MDAVSGELAVILLGGQRGTYQRYHELFADPVFDRDWRSNEAHPGQRAYQRYLWLLPKLPLAEIASDLPELVALHEWATIVDPHLGALLTVQVNLVLGTLLEQRSCGGDVAAAISELLTGRAVGAYVLTELGHGSDLNNLETIAEYDPVSEEFDLRTPTPTAVKFMPTTSPPPLAKVARFGVVFARLMLDGTDRGPYPFLIRLIDADGTVLPGITVRALPKKPALGMDNALTRFDGVRVGRECLLSPTRTRIGDDGQLVAPIPADSRVWRAISRVRWGRLCMAAMAAATARAALYLAVRHAGQRDIVNLAGSRVPLSKIRAHYARLLDAIADTYIATVAVRESVLAFNDITDEQAAPITDRVSLTKYFVTTIALHVCDEVHSRLGAHGAFAHNRIVEYQALRDAAATAEGDSYVIALQAAYRRLALPDEWTRDDWEGCPPCAIDYPDGWLRWMSARESYLHHLARQTYYNATGDAQTRWDQARHLALAAAEAHTARHAAQALADHASRLSAGLQDVVGNLVALFAIRQCLAHGAALLPDGPLPRLSRPLPELLDQLHQRLQPHLHTLVNAFDIPTGLLRTPFEAPDGFIMQYANALTHEAVSEASPE